MWNVIYVVAFMSKHSQIKSLMKKNFILQYIQQNLIKDSASPSLKTCPPHDCKLNLNPHTQAAHLPLTRTSFLVQCMHSADL